MQEYIPLLEVNTADEEGKEENILKLEEDNVGDSKKRKRSKEGAT